MRKRIVGMAHYLSHYLRALAVCRFSHCRLAKYPTRSDASQYLRFHGPQGRQKLTIDFDRPSGTEPLCIAPQALRAWLLSACPSGTKAIRPSRRLPIILALMGITPGIYFFGPKGHKLSPKIFASPTFSKRPNYARKKPRTIADDDSSIRS